MPVQPIIDSSAVLNVLRIVDMGLDDGNHDEAIPGKICVEEAVCLGLGLPHSDNPICVHPMIRIIKMNTNDAEVWLGNFDRAQHLRTLAVLQLGTRSKFKAGEFRRRVDAWLINKILTNEHVLKRLYRKQPKERLLRLQKLVAKTLAKPTLANISNLNWEVPYDNCCGPIQCMTNRGTNGDFYCRVVEELSSIGLKEKDRKPALRAGFQEWIKFLETTLIDMQVPGVQWLPLLESPDNPAA